VLIHFQIRGARGWEAMGSGTSDDADPLQGAIEDLRLLHGGGLPAGHYRYFEAGGAEPRSGEFELDSGGEMID
jgi:hypothetical protein